MNPPETAPRDRMVLGDFGWPSMMPCVWNNPSLGWACSTLQVEPYNGEWNDYYFETEFFPASDLKGWLEMPKGDK